MRFIFFPNDKQCKSITGGVRKDAPVTFSVVSDADKVSLIMTKDGQGNYPVAYIMEKHDETFTVTLTLTSKGLYFYSFTADGQRIGAGDDLRAQSGGRDYPLVCYDKDFTPLNGGVIYQIMPDRFNIGGQRLKTKDFAIYRDDWGGLPSQYGDRRANSYMFGGNLAGITQKLDYLRELGVTHIYLNPIFESASNHKYDTGDYNKIDSDFGDEDSFKELVSSAKERGIGIILDGVFSHTGADSVYFDKYGRYGSNGAYQSKDSPFYKWYRFEQYPDVYDCWWGFDSLPNVNETEETYLDFITGEGGVLDKYLKLGIEGWRLDVADELPTEFLQRVKTRAANAVIIGEVWENAAQKCAYGQRRSYLCGGELDGVMNYPFREGIINFFMTRNKCQLINTVEQIINDYPAQVTRNLFNLLSSHDTRRILTALTGENPHEKAGYKTPLYDQAKRKVMLAAMINFTLPGIPSIYYGDEAGMEGFEDPYCRGCFPWGKEDEELVSWFKRLGTLRHNYAEVFDGETIFVPAPIDVLAFCRKGTKTLFIVVNLSSEDYRIPFRGEIIISETDEKTVKPLSCAVFEVR